MKFFDVNLRPPFADPPLVMDLARRADVLKLNDGEVGQLAHWVRTGESILDTPRDDASIARDCQTLAEATSVYRVCVTRAEEGAALWERGKLTTAPAPHVEVKDTVGAGDAFMAGLMVGLTRGMDHRRVLENRLWPRCLCRVALWRNAVIAAGIDTAASLRLPKIAPARDRTERSNSNHSICLVGWIALLEDAVKRTSL